MLFTVRVICLILFSFFKDNYVVYYSCDLFNVVLFLLKICVLFAIRVICLILKKKKFKIFVLFTIRVICLIFFSIFLKIIMLFTIRVICLILIFSIFLRQL